MNYVLGLIMRLWHWLASWFRRAPKPLRAVHQKELPEQPDAGAVYVLGEGQQKWFVAMAIFRLRSTQHRSRMNVAARSIRPRYFVWNSSGAISIRYFRQTV